jgi:hypothetical protein
VVEVVADVEVDVGVEHPAMTAVDSMQMIRIDNSFILLTSLFLLDRNYSLFRSVSLFNETIREEDVFNE